MKHLQSTHSLLKPLLFIFILLLSITTYAQQHRGTIKGHILTNDNRPAENVSVRIKSLKMGTTTDENGNFSLRVPQGAYTLNVSHIGMESQDIAVEVKAGQVTVIPKISVAIKTGALDQVTITANKTNKYSRKKSDDLAKMPLDNMENSQVYSTITKDVLEDQMVTTVDAAIKNAPGVQTMWQATGRSGDGGSYYNSRGFILQSTLRNGVSGNVSNAIDAANLENLEVLKGPSATLFGSSLTSYGGLINRVTKKPYDTFGGQVSYTGGSYGFNRATADINTPLDSAKKLLFRLNTAFNYQGSFLDHGFARSLAVDPSLSYKINNRLNILLDAEIYNGRNTVQGFFFFPYGGNVNTALGTNNANGLNLDYRKAYNAGDLVQQTQSTNFFGQVNYKISNEWKSQTNFTSTYSYSNGFGPYYYLVNANTIDREDQSTKNSNDKTIEVQENITGDFKIAGHRNRFVFGLDFFNNNSNQFFFGSDLGNAPINSSTFNYNSFNQAAMDAIYKNAPGYTYPAIYKTNTYSTYVSDVFNITDQFVALAAVRFDRYDNKGSYDPSAQTTSGSYTQNEFSPKFGLVYQIVDKKVSLFGNYQNGFTNLTGTDYQGKTFKPQQANQVEGGVKLNLFDGKLSSTISYYDISVSNITRTYAPNPNFQIQDGTQASKGFEAEVIANPFAGFNVIAGFSYNDSKYTNDVQGLRPATASSPYTANLWLSYRLPATLIKGLGVGFGGNYASNNLVVNSVSQGQFTLPEFYVFNTTAFYEISHYRINLGVNNLTDKKYWTGYSTVNPQMLRQILAGVAYKF